MRKSKESGYTTSVPVHCPHCHGLLSKPYGYVTLLRRLAPGLGGSLGSARAMFTVSSAAKVLDVTRQRAHALIQEGVTAKAIEPVIEGAKTYRATRYGQSIASQWKKVKSKGRKSSAKRA